MDITARALEIAAAEGIVAERAEALPGGVVTHVVRVRSADDDVVVRCARDPGEYGDLFDVEAWCLRAAARAGVRTSQLVARGALEGTSYLVASYVPGVPAEAEDLEGWRAIGAFTASLREISTHDAPDALFSRFGRDLDRAWQQHLAYNLAALTTEDPLIGLGVYPPSRRQELREVLGSLSARSLPQGLLHHDLAHRNLLRHEGGYTVIDWGTASTGPVQWGDLAHLYRWHLLKDAQSPVSAAAWESVLEGAGLRRAEAEPVLRELLVLGALDIVRWAVDVRPDRLEEMTGSSRAVLSALE